MKNLIIALLSVATLASCSKVKDDNASPSVVNNKTTSTTTTTAPSASTTTISNAAYSVNFINPEQKAVTSVSENTLTVSFYEKALMLVNKEDYQLKWALHLLEDFSASKLGAMDYTTVTKEGHTTFNWVDDNLNNVLTKTETDTTVNGKVMVKIQVDRVFTFKKAYANNAAAVAAQNSMVGQRETLTYAAYFLTSVQTTPTYKGTATVVYSK